MLPNFEPKTPFTAIAKRDTWLKNFPAQAAECDRITKIDAGQKLAVLQATSELYKKHFFFLLGAEIEESRCWWAYSNDWQIEGNAPENDPQVQPNNVEVLPPEPEVEITFTVPGISSDLTPSSPIWFDGARTNFTWGEATKNGERIPTDANITRNIVMMAGFMDEIREFLGGHPIGITSWYRDPKTNARIGGSSLSSHMDGYAVDFYVVGDVISVVDVFSKLKSFVGNRGGLAVGNGFVHVDLRGVAARWSYPCGPRVDLW